MPKIPGVDDEKLKRCVRAVEAKGGAGSAWAVCIAALRGYSALSDETFSQLGDLVKEYGEDAVIKGLRELK